MNEFHDEPACWSWPLPAVLTAEQEIDRLMAENEREAGRLVEEGRVQAARDHLLPRSACRLLTRDWPSYLLSSWHDERCAICGVRPGHLVADHEHRTGYVRGRLCRGCNVSEGMNRDGDSVYGLYRYRPPAAILDVRIYYVGRGWPDGWWRDTGLARQLTGNQAWEPLAEL